MASHHREAGGGEAYEHVCYSCGGMVHQHCVVGPLLVTSSQWHLLGSALRQVCSWWLFSVLKGLRFGLWQHPVNRVPCMVHV